LAVGATSPLTKCGDRTPRRRDICTEKRVCLRWRFNSVFYIANKVRIGGYVMVRVRVRGSINLCEWTSVSKMGKLRLLRKFSLDHSLSGLPSI